MENFLKYLIIMGAIFFLMREIMLWYYKINNMVNLLENLEIEMQENNKYLKRLVENQTNYSKSVSYDKKYDDLNSKNSTNKVPDISNKSNDKVENESFDDNFKNKSNKTFFQLYIEAYDLYNLNHPTKNQLYKAKEIFEYIIDNDPSSTAGKNSKIILKDLKRKFNRI